MKLDMTCGVELRLALLFLIDLHIFKVESLYDTLPFKSKTLLCSEYKSSQGMDAANFQAGVKKG